MLAACASSSVTTGQSPAPDGGDAAAQATKTDSAFTKALKSSVAHEGLFTIYQDSVTGKTHLAIQPDQLDREFIYFTYTENGVVWAGQFRGRFRDNKVFTIRKRFERIEFVTLNDNYYFDPDNALVRAETANISEAVMASEKIVGIQDSTGTILIDGDGLFLTEFLSRVKAPSPAGARPGAFFTLGSLSKDKTRIDAIRNYPKNTDVVVSYVYDNMNARNGGGPDVTDARFVTITVQHSLIEMPENDFQPRFDDARIGYFTQQVTDLTSISATPYRDMINRWSLVKQDPNAAISEPVEPITWWIENTTPVELRPTIREAALAWNLAFEAAGFRNAVVVMEQPDDADWDAGDVRYNVLRWTSSPNPPFGGYGPSFVNPRTGQIIGADIMLEFSFVTNRVFQDRVFETAALGLPDSTSGLLAGFDGADPHVCSLGMHLHNNTLFGLHALRAFGVEDYEVDAYLRQALHFLVLHEIGHTLGLNHNMKASQLHTLEEINDAELTAALGLTGSIMDYPAVNVAPRGTMQGQYYSTRPGPYDLWAIEFGYSPEVAGMEAEEARLESILSRSTDPQLFFGNDADDMRAPGKAIDPRVMINDMSRDAISYSAQRVGLANDVMAEIGTKFAEPGQSYQEMRNAYFTLTGQQAWALWTISRYIGGLYVDRAVVGQPGATQPFMPVAAADQRRAMEALAVHAFAPDAWDAPADLYRHLQTQRRGFNFFVTTEDPKIHARVLGIQQATLAHLLHPRVLARITDTELYGNGYPLATYMVDLNRAIFSADASGTVNTFRQNLQAAYTNRLIAILGQDSNYSYPARSMAYRNLMAIKQLAEGNEAGDALTRAHRAYLVHIIDEGTDEY
jgi:hypothetical protein